MHHRVLILFHNHLYFFLFTTTILTLFPASQLYLIQIVAMSFLQLLVFL